MTNLAVTECGGELRVDSRLIAERLGQDHNDWFNNILLPYQAQVEQVFGVLRFQNVKPPAGSRGGRPKRYALLTEDQATFFMTLSRNTPEVVQCKLELVQAFSTAKKLLSARSQPTKPLLNVYTKRLIAFKDVVLPDEYWAVLDKGKDVLLHVEGVLQLPVDKFDLCDGSIGSHWSKYRKDKPWCQEAKTYELWMPGREMTVFPKCYHDDELVPFSRWLKSTYMKDHLPRYLKEKYGALVAV